MKRSGVASIAVILFSLVVLGSAVQAVEEPTLDRVGLLSKQLLSEIEKLEEKYPQDHVSFFKMRETLADLLQSNVAVVPEPEFQRKSRVPANFDPKVGCDLYTTVMRQRDRQLVNSLRGLVSEQTPVGYQQAQDIIFSKLDNHEGTVECVYTGRTIQTQGEPDATNMNVEHTWPQSQGATGIAKSDLHHLFPSDSKANNIRGNFPFGEVGNPTWEQGGSKFDGDNFEPRPCHKGNVARAMFYFSVRYNKSIPTEQEKTFRRWHQEDPVDASEKARNDRVENFQHNRNPFVDHPEFVDQINDF